MRGTSNRAAPHSEPGSGASPAAESAVKITLERPSELE